MLKFTAMPVTGPMKLCDSTCPSRGCAKAAEPVTCTTRMAISNCAHDRINRLLVRCLILSMRGDQSAYKHNGSSSKDTLRILRTSPTDQSMVSDREGPCR